MSDERDDTRPSVPPGDATQVGGRPGVDDETQVGGFPDADDAIRPAGRPGDAIRPGGRPGVDDATRAAAGPDDDRTRAGGQPGGGGDQTWVSGQGEDDDRTRVGGRPGVDDQTRVGGQPGMGDETVLAPVPPRRADATSVMPPANDDWAASRANAAWSGRAEVRAPQPARSGYPATDDWSVPPVREPRDRWWMPIVVGIIALVLLAALGWGIYVIAQNSDNDAPPAPATPSAAAPTQTTPSTPPSTEPSSAPTTTASTTEPTETEIKVPALVGMPLPEAQAQLSNEGLRWRVIYRADDALAGTVIDSDPAEGQEVPADTRITLVVAGGSPATSATPTTTKTNDTTGN